MLYWDFDDNDSGAVFDKSGNGNHGTIAGTVVEETVVGNNKNVSFAGAGDISSPNFSIPNNGAISVSGWYKMTNSDQGALMAKGNIGTGLFVLFNAV